MGAHRCEIEADAFVFDAQHEFMSRELKGHCCRGHCRVLGDVPQGFLRCPIDAKGNVLL
jgi:hypothetical protein